MGDPPTAPDIEVEIVAAWPEQVFRKKLRLPAGMRLAEAIALSGLEFNADRTAAGDLKIGVFGERRKATDMAADGDRIELYRALTADPKEARRKRARNK